MGNLGTQYGALGEATQQLGAADTGLLSGLGGLERQVEQTQLDAIRTNQTSRSDGSLPASWALFLTYIEGLLLHRWRSLLKVLLALVRLQSAVGLGVGALSTAAGASKAGLF
jgi:hypothetical protein